VALLVAYFCFPFLGLAKEEIKRRYSIPEGPAIETLKRAAIQGKIEIVYTAPTVGGIKTQSVRGRFYPREALDRMLEDTPLEVVRDRMSGAYTVVRKEGDRGPNRDPSQTELNENNHFKRETDMHSQSKKKEKMLDNAFKTLISALVVAGAITADAQDEEEEIITLTPFEVKADPEDSYRAVNLNSITGTRTTLENVPASAEVFTKTFIEDLAIDDPTQILTRFGGSTAGNAAGPPSRGRNVGEGGQFPARFFNLRGLGGQVPRAN